VSTNSNIYKRFVSKGLSRFMSTIAIMISVFVVKL